MVIRPIKRGARLLAAGSASSFSSLAERRSLSSAQLQQAAAATRARSFSSGCSALPSPVS
jgi:hypothetical protein